METMTIYYCGTDSHFGQDGALFESREEMERVATALANEYECNVGELIAAIEEIDIADADQDQCQAMLATNRALNALSGETESRIRARLEKQTMDEKFLAELDELEAFWEQSAEDDRQWRAEQMAEYKRDFIAGKFEKVCEVSNDFHNSKSKIILRCGEMPSERAIQATRRELCGLSDCKCADGELGQRGPQNEVFRAWLDSVSDSVRA